jgi:hypothetical protein
VKGSALNKHRPQGQNKGPRSELLQRVRQKPPREVVRKACRKAVAKACPLILVRIAADIHQFLSVPTNLWITFFALKFALKVSAQDLAGTPPNVRKTQGNTQFQD